MTFSRISIAREQGLDLAPGARVLCLDPEGEADFTALPQAGLHLVQGLRPAYDRLVARGFAPSAVLADADTGFDAVVVAIPRARALAQRRLFQAAQALRPGGLLLVDGAKTDGIDSLFKACRARLDGADSLTKAHGRLFWGRPLPGAFADWAETDADWPKVDGFVTGPGLFSAEHVDPGSAMLAAALPGDLSGRVADLGAGWGFLSARILQSPKVTALDLVEADHAALAAARTNITDDRAKFHWADATVWQPEQALDAVVTNPPFHAGRRPDYALGQAFIASAARALRPHGTLWLVANRHLPYETTLGGLFRDVQELSGSAAFKVLHAVKPRR